MTSLGDARLLAEQVIVGPHDEVREPGRDGARAAWARVFLCRVSGRHLPYAPVAVRRRLEPREAGQNALEVEVLAVVVRLRGAALAAAASGSGARGAAGTVGTRHAPILSRPR